MTIKNLLLISTLVILSHTCAPGQRTFILRNQCNYPIWPAEVGNGWQMNPGTVATRCLDSTWPSGRFWARTGCRFGSNGMCDPPSTPCCDTGNCLAGSGFGMVCTGAGSPPATLAEFTLLDYPNVDTYDVSNVDGATTPIEIKPIPGTFHQTPRPRILTLNRYHIPCIDDSDCRRVYSFGKCDANISMCVDDSVEAQGYYCGSPGCTPSTCSDFSLKPCDWQISPGEYSTQLAYVASIPCQGGCSCHNGQYCQCSSDRDCPGGTTCGQDLIPGVGSVQTCGHLVGWQTPKQICALNGGLGNPLGCNYNVPGQGVRTNLYACTGPNGGSCYTRGASSNCCGCPSWSIPGTCQNNNAQWDNFAENPIKVFKDACPTAYSFPYDDLTSTFTCRGTSASNQVGYTVTFCP